jgi:hypothetical protein
VTTFVDFRRLMGVVAHLIAADCERKPLWSTAAPNAVSAGC